MLEEKLKNFTYAQRERLAFIDLCLFFLGEVSRSDLANFFNIKSAACTRDIAAYKSLAPNNLILVHQTKRYHATENFIPLFDHEPIEALTKLTQVHNLSNTDLNHIDENLLDVVRQPTPPIETLASITLAIYRKYQITCDYVSISSGHSKRVLYPHSLAFNGLRWHVRAFDRKTNEFRDFVCNRLSNLTTAPITSSIRESVMSDLEWNTEVTLKVVPHPKLKHKDAVIQDFNMEGGYLKLNTKAALAGYILERLKVDCSKSGSLDPFKCQLFLANRKDVTGFKSMELAPGYQSNNNGN
ncbi:helix-turn-helix transcriptional regulator [Thalassotalea montiporae]